MLCSELTPGGMFGRMSGQRSRMNLGDGDEACFGPNRARPTRCSQSIEKRCSPLPRLVHGKHFPLPWHPSRGRSRPPGQPSLGSPGPVRVPDCPPASQPVPSACSVRCSPHHPFTVVCRHISPARGWPAGTYPLLLPLSPPTPRLTFLTPSIHQRLAARTLLHPSASKPADNSSSCPLQSPLPAPLSCQYRHTWPGRGIGSSIWERGARESTASTRLRRP